MSDSVRERFASHLHARLGQASLPPEDLAARIGRVLAPTRSIVLAPPDAAAVAAALAECTAEGWPVLAAGSATWLPSTESASDRAPVVISTARLERVTEHEPADLVIGVQAGFHLARLREHLAATRQWLPLDPPAAESATIGAAAALASAGPLRAAHGTIRDMALGIELATADGRLLRFGGRVVKNVAGYDGVRLAVGSRGALGIITGIYLRVRGAPHVDRTLAMACGPGLDGAARGAAAALAVRDAVNADALELLSPATSARLAGGDQARAGWTLLVRLTGGEAAVADGVERVTRLNARGGASGENPAAPRMAEVPARVWDALSRLESQAPLAIALTGPPAKLAAGLDGVSDIIASGNGMGEWMGAAHAADGVIRVWRPDASAESAAAIAGALQRMRSGGAGGEWTIRSVRGPDVGRSTNAAPAVRELTRRLVAVFDRAGIMQAGAGME